MPGQKMVGLFGGIIMKIIFELAGQEFGIVTDTMNFNLCKVARATKAKENKKEVIRVGDPIFKPSFKHSCSLRTIIECAVTNVTGGADCATLQELVSLCDCIHKDLQEFARVNLNTIHDEVKAELKATKPKTAPAAPKTQTPEVEPYDPFAAPSAPVDPFS